MKHKSCLPVLFTLVMLACVLFLVWYLPAIGQRRFSLEDVQKSLETSLGRERKQQYEYDETVAAIPLTEAAGQDRTAGEAPGGGYRPFPL